jgi:DnaK suppressor protein
VVENEIETRTNRRRKKMTAKLNSVQKALESKLKEARAALGHRDGIIIEPTADPVDTTQQAADRELATQNLDRNAKLVRQILAAMDRIQEGSYGICLNCEEEISQKRLAVIPWADFCIHCQEQADQGSYGEHVHFPLAA